MVLVWLRGTVKALDSKVSALDSKVSGLDSKVTNLATDVAVLRGRQDERDKREQIEVNRLQFAKAIRDGAIGDR